MIYSANSLFARKGYQHTKLAEVAEGAGLHVQTLYRHFKTKEELAAAAAQVVLNDCRAHFEGASEDQSTFEIWRGWIARTVTYLASLGFGEHKRRQLRSVSSLMNDNYLLAVYSGYEDLLTEYLALDFRIKREHSRLPRLVACMLWSGNEAAVKRCAGLDRGQDTLMDVNSVLAESLGVVDDVEAAFASYVHLPRTTQGSVPRGGS
ncbi:MAG: TetR/AcrR family transcriptional regulator [Gammaproteobacteria bacterium]|nr:TetR/AcrR family transcriptional regulator [Gammaproteobacteria bacterium]MDE0365832.1 TetR/AcrR family transcriptional regulator [Gammaproteobacteria bacterium]